MDQQRIEDVGPPNPRQAEVDRIRDAAASNLGRAARQSAARQVAGRVSEAVPSSDTARAPRAD